MTLAEVLISPDIECPVCGARPWVPCELLKLKGGMVHYTWHAARVTGRAPAPAPAPAPCCERDHDGDGNCDRHPNGRDMTLAEAWKVLARAAELKAAGSWAAELKGVDAALGAFERANAPEAATCLAFMAASPEVLRALGHGMRARAEAEDEDREGCECAEPSCPCRPLPGVDAGEGSWCQGAARGRCPRCRQPLCADCLDYHKCKR